MKHSVAFKLLGSVSTSKGSEESSKVYRAIASTDDLDRDLEVLMPKGVMLDSFLKNPIMLNIHNYRDLAVGKVISINVEDSKITFDFEFAPTEQGKNLELLYSKGFMSAFSVGFYPKKYYYVSEGTKSLEVELPDGNLETFDLSSYKETPRYVISQWELLEISPVSVPANPEALLTRSADFAVRKCFNEPSSAAAQILQVQVDQKTQELTKMLKEFNDSLDVLKLTNNIPYEKSDIDMESDWDNLGVSLVKWSCEDGSGDKEKMNWGKYSKGFAFVDSKKPDSFISYKYAHHALNGDNLIAVWKGVANSMYELLSAKDFDEAKEVYNHLAAHYKDAGMEAPSFEKDYTKEELIQIKNATFKEVKQAQIEPVTPENVQTSDSKESDLKEIKNSLVEMNEIHKIRLNLIMDAIKDVQKEISTISEKSVNMKPTDNLEINSQIVELNKLLKTVNLQ